MRSSATWAWLLLVCLGCSPASEGPLEQDARLAVFVVNDPLRYLAERLGGDAVVVSFPAPPGIDPAGWQPDAETIAAYQSADLILLNGAGYAEWVSRATLPRASLVDTSAGFADRLIPLDAGPSHRHGPEGAHSHAATAFTTWLDPALAAEQARAIAQAFRSARPEDSAAFDARLAELEAELRDLDARLRAAAEVRAGRPVLFSHPVYAYLIRAYALDARSLDWEPDAVPTAAQWRAFDPGPAQVLFWESKPLPETVARLEALGVRSRVFDPGANTPASGDWLQVMRANAAALGAAD